MSSKAGTMVSAATGVAAAVPAPARDRRDVPQAAPDGDPPYLGGPPLFWRLLAANLFVVLGGAVVGTALTQRFVLSGRFTPLTHALMVLVAIVLSAGLTALILHVAFRPLRALRDAIEQSGAAAPSTTPTPVRVALSRFDDPDIQAVARAVNGLWDRLDQQVRLLEHSNRRLAEQREELAAKSAELERLATMALAAQEDERRRLARELHDGTMQSVAALIMGLERGLQAMPGDVPHLRAAHQTTARLRDLATRTLEEIRHLALDLRPAVLDDHGLVPAVRWLAEQERERFGVDALVELGGDFAQVGDAADSPRLPAAVETASFRIVQEALTNVAKHARAQSVVVRLIHQGDAVTLEVEDDGVGIAVDAVPPPGHMGLFNMRERAMLLGGRCEITPAPAGHGTLVHAVIPLPSVPVAAADVGDPGGAGLPGVLAAPPAHAPVAATTPRVAVAAVFSQR